MFSSLTTLHWPAQIAANTMTLANIRAASTYILEGDVPTAANPRLKGTIEHIAAYLNTSAQCGFDVVFFRKDVGGTTAPTTDSYIDHQSFAKTDFVTWSGATKPRYAGISGLAIPYVDSDKTGEFHIGISNNTTAIPAKSLTLRFSWRADLGE